jgi:site-specific recombinase XerD
MPTTIKIPSESWDQKNQEVLKIEGDYGNKVRNSLNLKLKNFKNTIDNSIYLADIQGELINVPWVRNQSEMFWQNQGKKKDEEWKLFFNAWVKKYIKDLDVKASTKRSYNTFLHRFEDFQGKTRYKLREVDSDLLRKYAKWMTKEKFAVSSIAKTIKFTKKMVQKAQVEGLRITPNYENFKYIKKEPEFIEPYLTKEEIDQVWNWKPPTDSMQNVKDLFLVGLHTGLRVSDLMIIADEKPIIEDDIMTVNNKKTGFNAVIPLDERIEPLIKSVRAISDQRFNEYIKDIAKDLKWNGKIKGKLTETDDITGKTRKVSGKYPKHELVSSHIMRRSYATNRYLEGDDLVEICASTGHSTTGMLLNYLKVSKKEHAQKKLERMRVEKQK